MTTMPEDVITLPLSFRIPCGAEHLLTTDNDRLEVVRHLITIYRSAIPNLDRQQLPDFFFDKLLSKSKAWIETLVVPTCKIRPVSRTFAHNASPSSTVTPIGFSTSTCLPALSACMASGT